MVALANSMKVAHEVLRDQQKEIRSTHKKEPLLFKAGHWVWLEHRRRKQGEKPKLLPKLVGPYQVLEIHKNHTYLIEISGQHPWQNKSRLKLYRKCEVQVGKAPLTLEPRSRPNMKGATKRERRTQVKQEVTTEDLVEEFPPLETDVHEQDFTPIPDILPKRAIDGTEMNEQEAHSNVTVEKKTQDDKVEPQHSPRTTKRPDRFGGNIYKWVISSKLVQNEKKSPQKIVEPK